MVFLVIVLFLKIREIESRSWSGRGELRLAPLLGDMAYST
jgi:hypothetical protein